MEHVKWNAPSFCYAGEDMVTFRLYAQDRAQLVFHRGSRVREDADTDHLRWATNDRTVVPLRDAEARQLEFVSVVNRWVVAQGPVLKKL